MSIHSLGYIGVNSVNPQEWAEYGTEVLGMEDVSSRYESIPDAVLLKMDNSPFRIIAQPASENSFAFAAWEASSESGMQAQIERIQAVGIDVQPGSDEEMAHRAVQGLAFFEDPAGNHHEIYWGRKSDCKRMISPAGVRKFITDPIGVGHIVLPAPNFDETASFFIDTLGFGISDTMSLKFTDDPAEPVKRIWFLHCNARHHSLALFEMPVPHGCVHAMFEVDSVDEVGRANDRRIAKNVALSATLGRHTNDEMISFYMTSPGGFDIEYGAEGKTVEDWEKHPAFESTSVSLWGHDFSVGQASS